MAKNETEKQKTEQTPSPSKTNIGVIWQFLKISPESRTQFKNVNITEFD